MQSLLEDIDSRSRHISQLFSGADPQWREIVGYDNRAIARLPWVTDDEVFRAADRVA